MQIPYSEKLNTAGLDASEELVRLAKERLGIPVFTADNRKCQC
jgi:hypothetical protein